MRAAGRGSNLHDVMQCIGRSHGYIPSRRLGKMIRFIQWTLVAVGSDFRCVPTKTLFVCMVVSSIIKRVRLFSPLLFHHSAFAIVEMRGPGHSGIGKECIDGEWRSIYVYN